MSSITTRDSLRNRASTWLSNRAAWPEHHPGRLAQVLSQRERAALVVGDLLLGDAYVEENVDGRHQVVGGLVEAQRVLVVAVGVELVGALEATRRNGELDRWRQDRKLPAHELPEPISQAA